MNTTASYEVVPSSVLSPVPLSFIAPPRYPALFAYNPILQHQFQFTIKNIFQKRFISCYAS